ncbi:MAG TPA: cation:proton antiporter [Terracidiphilus sp.]|nr:cation:proton antiporter [Terracidiphilus sp.]
MPVHDVSVIFIELGATACVLAVLARIAARFGVSSIPLYLCAGLICGNGGLIPLNLSRSFIQIGAEIGVLLLLFMLGLEYSGDQLRSTLRSGVSAGILDLALNFPPGLIAGLLLGFAPLPAVLLGGVTAVSSSGIVARLLAEPGRTRHPETSTVLSILVLEDIAMALFLPLVAVLVAGGSPGRIVIAIAVAASVIALALFTAIRFGQSLSSFLAHQSDEVILLSLFGVLLLVAAAAERVQVSAAIGAFLVGIAVSGPLAEQSHRLIAPLRDLFSATFFFFFGLEVNPRNLLPVLGAACLLALASILTKIATGYWSTRPLGKGLRMRLRAGLVLIAHGEFSIVIAGLGAALEPRLGPLSAGYVLLLAILGPVAARFAR